DLPLSACFAAGMLLAAEWAHSGLRRRLPLAGVCFGLALLAKGPLAGVLALPLVWTSRRRWRDWWRVAFPALLVAGPWYVLCAARNGTAFVDEFFLKHNLGRFASSELQHVQPFWFYVPVLLLGLFPWTPLVALLRRPANPWERLLWMWLGFGFVFFSLSVNKLPGYLLPLLPAAAALLGVHLDRAVESRRVMVVAAGLLGLLPAVAIILPDALVTGVRRASAGAQLAPALPWVVAFAAVVWIVHRWKGLPAAFVAMALLCCAALGYLQQVAAPALDKRVSARGLGVQSCIGSVNRSMRYGLNHYAGRALPDCEPPRMVQ
ncbi:MAG: hypothetical protein HY820_05540, partial [Acidobacteria bacterium]|nr:hypothetical protein [Acidobacteriota bacterium]